MTVEEIALEDLKDILRDEYDTSIYHFSPSPILWAAEKLAETADVNYVKMGLKELNRRRHLAGKPVAVFQFGHPLF